MFTKKRLLPFAVAMILGGAVSAQETSGTIFGRAPTGDNESIQLSGGNMATREIAVKSGGCYSFNELPVGTYTVKLLRGGEALDSRTVTVSAGCGTQVSFADAKTNAKQLTGVTVTATTPPIDTTQTDVRTTLTQKQRQALPLASSAEAIAMILPLFAPYAAQDQWAMPGHEPTVPPAVWPAAAPALLVADEIPVVVPVDG